MKKLTSILLALLLVLSLSAAAFAAETVDAVRSMIEALPTVEEFQGMNEDDRLDAYNRTQAAYDAFGALSDGEKAELEGAETVFEALFAHYNTLIAPAAEAEAGETKSGYSPLVWILLAVMAAVVIAPMYQKKKTA